MPRTRVDGIDFLKFLAVLLIINSHSDVLYVRWQALATGGAIGDCLFLFISGFTLFLGRAMRFDNYYKRRLQRILPSVLAAGIFITVVDPERQLTAVDLAGGEFIIAILIYYVLLYPVRRWFTDRLPAVGAVVCATTLAVYVFWFPYKTMTGPAGPYGHTTLFRWIPYFGFMLLGAATGLRHEAGRAYRAWPNFLAMLACTVLFYGIQLIAAHNLRLAPWQIVSLIPLAGVVVYMYRWSCSQAISKLFDVKFVRIVIIGIGGLCLESYLIQFSLLTTRFNHLWPLNLIIVTCGILVSAYVVRCVARFIAQTFRTEDYDWKKIFSLY